jgi:hypothetical protein
MTPFFCDGLKDVTIINGAARLEFHRLHPARNGELQAVSEVLVAVPMRGLVQMLEVLEQVRERLAQEKSLDSPRADSTQLPQEELPTSPNFA